MVKFLVVIILGMLLATGFMYLKNMKGEKSITAVNSGNSIHSLTAKPLLGSEDISLDKYKGKVMLIVNTASKCGLTPQYGDLQKLHESYADKGLAILGFPSNDFMKQEPRSAAEIGEFCQKNYGVEFDMFEKVKVKGNHKHPVYKFLTEKEQNGVLDSKVKWNFQKYLLNKEGQLIAVFMPKTTVKEVIFLQKLDSLLQ